MRVLTLCDDGSFVQARVVSADDAAALQKVIDMHNFSIRNATALEHAIHRHQQAHEQDRALVREILDFENHLNSMPRETDEESGALVSLWRSVQAGLPL